VRLIRSLLFAPANRHDLVKKFLRYPADAFAVDLEDGTPEAEKVEARRQLPAIVSFLRRQGLKAQLFVRANAPRSRHVEADLDAALHVDVDGVMMPKLEDVSELEMIAVKLSHAEGSGGSGARRLHLIGVIETARGVANVERLAIAQDAHLAALAFGAEDFITDVSGRRTPEGLEVLYARSRVILAATVAGVQALDQVFVNIRDDESFRRDAQQGRQLGYGGKMCVTPRQVEIANSVFSPSAEEVIRSRRLIEVYEKAQEEGRGTIEFEGGMIDEPLLKRARAILQLAADIGSPPS
jgi:citrate lyase subunit beta/citryl-CoA lyase